MNDTLTYDEAASQRLLAVYRTPDVAAQRARFVQLLDPRPGESILDLGSGPGLLAALIAQAIGPDGELCGLEISEPLIALARQHGAQQPWVHWQHGDAVALPQPDASFDAAISVQVLEYIDDVDRALAEVARVLKPGGRFVAVDTDWDSIVWHSADPQRMRRVLAAWLRHAPHPHLPRTLGPRLERAGFKLLDRRLLPLFTPEAPPECYWRAMIDLVGSYVTQHGGIGEREARRWREDLDSAERAGEAFFSVNRYGFVAVKP